MMDIGYFYGYLFNMIEVIYADKKPAIRKQNNKEEIYCIIRKRWLLLTPEEWVRQNFLIYLTEVKNYPIALIAVEKQFIVSEVKKRFDILVFDKLTNPKIIIECKEMSIRINENVFHQVLSYYSAIQSSYIIITNGTHTLGFKRNQQDIIPITEIPDWQ